MHVPVLCGHGLFFDDEPIDVTIYNTPGSFYLTTYIVLQPLTMGYEIQCRIKSTRRRTHHGRTQPGVSDMHHPLTHIYPRPNPTRCFMLHKTRDKRSASTPTHTHRSTISLFSSALSPASLILGTEPNCESFEVSASLLCELKAGFSTRPFTNTHRWFFTKWPFT